MTWRLSLLACLCACDYTYVSASPTPYLSYFHERTPPTPLCSDCALTAGYLLILPRGSTTPGSNWDCRSSAFPKPLKLPSAENGSRREGEGGGGGGEEGGGKEGAAEGLSPKSLQDAFHWSRSSESLGVG